MDINVLPMKNSKYLDLLMAMNRSDKVHFTSPSNFLKQKMIALGFHPKKISIIYNAYNKNFDCVKTKKTWAFGDQLRLLNIGRFEEVKGQRYLLEAIAIVSKEYANIKLSLVGYGSLYDELNHLTDKLGIRDKVFFVHQAAHSQIPVLMSESDIYIQPSVVASDGAEENLSVATIEAQVSGLPCIASNIGGLKEIVIDDVTGKLVAYSSPQAISSAILSYIGNPDLLRSHSYSCYHYSRSKFSRSKITSHLLRIYEKV